MMSYHVPSIHMISDWQRVGWRWSSTVDGIHLAMEGPGDKRPSSWKGIVSLEYMAGYSLGGWTGGQGRIWWI